jgi:hypothetical protein
MARRWPESSRSSPGWTPSERIAEATQPTPTDVSPEERRSTTARARRAARRASWTRS